MALKDWKKIRENRYKTKDGIGEVWIDERKHYRVNKNMTSGVKSYYYFHHVHFGDGGRTELEVFDSKAKAHARLMKIIKTQDY